MKKILVIEDDMIFGRSIGNWLRKQGMECSHVATLASARKTLASDEFDLVLADLRLPDGNSTELLRWMHEKCLASPFLIMTNYGQVENAVEAMRLGAANYLCKPVQPDRLLEAIRKEFSRPRHDGTEFYRGESDKAREMYRRISLIAPSDISVLIRGASGTGKEHIARELHEQSRRRNRPCVTLDCGALAADLAASELFGHRKGTFTGAENDKAGLFQEADGGTLFLDEIGNLSYKSQMLLLRALQEKCYRPVGSTRERSFDIRLIAATNENLEEAIAGGRFREDLFHRLNEFTIRVPLLSECPEDILPLARFLLGHLSEEHHKRVQGFDRLAEAALRRYPWPGNIRELRNTLRSALLLADGDRITATDLNLDLTLKQAEVPCLTEEEKERQLLIQTLEQNGNNRARAARMLDISRTTLYEKLRKYGII
ncbi:sigma-54-dependent transcriptional regulator [Phocaeicola vulgatus]|jgi:two-component system response regulator HydG|uniref:Sigma-54-dependent Fis family transcriptional regulator n=1 Tax=Phocaeicola vulgatus TaxID=821 RepID=A0A415BSV1_PHOVU|nr:sigma-54 dependent transcriptional regulator [Phocaeicola vulgatus]RHI92168.1 sigma-54-dependent Fis family transcriptional regulator [Phocaeicola vulgatus]